MGSSETVGLVILFCSLVCLGTWPALLRLCSLKLDNASLCQHPRANKYTCTAYGQRIGNRFRREHPRNISHVYLDYAIAYFLVSCCSLLGVVVMQNETIQATADTPMALILTSMLGGSLLSVGNLSLQWATVVFDASLTTVLAIQASLTVVLGTSLNYVLEPTITPRPSLLVAGVVVFLIAIALATRAQVLYSRHKLDPSASIQRESSSTLDNENEDVSNMLAFEMERPYGNSIASSIPFHDMRPSDREKLFLYNEKNNSGQGLDDYNATVDTSATSTVPIDDPSHFTIAQAPILAYGNTFWGVIVAVMGGLCFGFFSPAFNIAVNDPFHWIEDKKDSDTPADSDDNHLSVVRANLWFSLAFLLASVVGNIILLCREQVHQRGTFSITMMIHHYVTHDTITDRILAWSAGIVCALGNVLQFQGGQRVGYATADLVQAFPLVSTIWDVMIFGEFASLQMCSNLGMLLAGMYIAYGIGIVLLAGSSIAA